MTTLTLVRHGQASFGARNYDELSALGVRQSRVLGEHWRELQLAFDAAHSGAMARQSATAHAALAELAGAPPLATSDAFNEYDHQGLIRAYAPVVAREHPQFAVERRALFADPRTFQGFFEKVIACWVTARDGAEPIAETWPAFCARVRDGLTRAAAGAGQVVIFTSGGCITAALREALQLADAHAFAANRRIFNASVHTFRLGRRGLSLTGFNNVAHLELARDPALLTFR